MADFIIIAILVLLVGSALRYIRKSSKKGVKCVGCPYAASCSSQKSCSGSGKGGSGR